MRIRMKGGSKRKRKISMSTKSSKRNHWPRKNSNPDFLSWHSEKNLIRLSTYANMQFFFLVTAGIIRTGYNKNFNHPMLTIRTSVLVLQQTKTWCHLQNLINKKKIRHQYICFPVVLQSQQNKCFYRNNNFNITSIQIKLYCSELILNKYEALIMRDYCFTLLC